MEGNKDGNSVSSASCPPPSRRKRFASYAIFDTEATGLTRRPAITELCILAVLTDELQSTSRPIPRVVNKLQLCFNPKCVIQPEASRITGLFNDVLEQMSSFQPQASLVTTFLTSLPQPVCIIAHNGLRFDFPLLQSEFHKASHSLPADSDIYCSDSWEAFRVLDGLPAVPDWVLQRDRNEQQMRKASAQKKATTPWRKIDNGFANNVSPAPSESVQNEDEISEPESKVLSPTKRTHLNSASDDAEAAESKLSKMESAPLLDSQSSVTDVDLVTAYDAAICDAGENVEGRVSPVLDAEERVSPVPVESDDNSLQSQQETTPIKDPSLTNPGPGPIVKKPPPTSVDSAQAKQVVRRLFNNEAASSNVQSAVNNDCSPPKQGHKDVESAALPFQGSLPDESLVQGGGTNESGVSSLASCGAGEPAFMHKEQGAESVTRHCGDQQSSFQQPERESKKNVDSTRSAHAQPEIVSGLAQTCAQKQVSEVTSPSSSSSSFGTGKSTDARPPSQHQSSPSPTRKVSYRLGEIYRRQFGRYPEVSHTAEDDCLALLKVIVSKRSEFMAFVEGHAVRFDSIGPMY